MGLPIRKSRFLELNRHRAAVLVLRPLEPGVCQLGDLTGRFLPRDGRTGLKLITESGVKGDQHRPWPSRGVAAPEMSSRSSRKEFAEVCSLIRAGEDSSLPSTNKNSSITELFYSEVSFK